jgi:hypothetical protein
VNTRAVREDCGAFWTPDSSAGPQH